ncbi:MAG: hypothetical protein KIT10_13705 [Flavobacteriales bacterium]|nr:hypothetical protein [Flavobacteriales bacterium]
MRTLSFTLLSAIPLMIMGHRAHAQAKAQPCFFSVDFEDGTIPAGWDIGPQVERQTADGSGLGEFVPAWTVGNALQANAGGFFPVPDLPAGNRFAMANDDAPPCNCDMQQVAITAQAIDLGGRSGTALECRVFHEQTLGGGPAYVEASIDGTSWITMALVPAQPGGWRDLVVNLSAFDGQPALRLRFRWSDNGQWASGFAVDDICLRERLAYDLSVAQAFTHDPSVSPFTMGDQSLRYRLLPLEQAGPLTVAVEVVNRGLQPMPQVNAAVVINHEGVDHGPFAGEAIPLLVPGESAILPIATGWTPSTTGTLNVGVTVSGGVADLDETDNSGNATMRITGPDWADGYGAMARDEDQPVGFVGGDEVFIAGNRMELAMGGTAPTGISAVFGAGTEDSTVVRAILMDLNMALVDTSTRHVISEEDLARIAVGEPLFLPFANPSTLPAGDYFVGMQRLSDPDNGVVHVLVSGSGAAGGAFFMEGPNFLLSWMLATPMVRLHFADYGVGVTEVSEERVNSLHVFPVPMQGGGWVSFTLDHSAALRLVMRDMQGREVGSRSHGTLGKGSHQMPVDVSGLAAGTYLLGLEGEGIRLVRTIVVATP